MGRASRNPRSKSQAGAVLKELPADAEDVYKKLKLWMVSHSWKAVCNLIPHVFETTGRGLMTLEKVKSGQVVLQIPKSLLITTFVVSQNPICNLFSNQKSYSAQCVLAIFLIFEKHLGQSSYWKYYLDTLPTYYSNPQFCSKVEKKYLPHFISSELDTLSQRLKSNFISVMESIKMLHNNTCYHCQSSLFDIFTFHRFAWAYYTVNTRAIYINDERQKCLSINIQGNDNLAMAPFLDLFNHNCETVADAQLISTSNNEEYYQIRALRSYDSQTQVFITYGAHSSLKLYLEYGFFIPNNPLDQIFFTLSDIEKYHRLSASASRFIKDSQLDRTMGFTVEGLNYSAKNVLFVVTTDIVKQSSWKEKLYSEKFDNKDLKLLTDLGLRILQSKEYEYAKILENMSKIVRRSESFNIAINLIREYMKIIEKSLKYMKALSHN